MPKILARDPSWLAKGSPGYEFFQQTAQQSKTAQNVREGGAVRRIAHRGTEIFAVVGNELRWSELGALKDGGEQQRKNRNKNVEDGQAEKAYRVLKTPISRAITQLSVSPSGNYMAILTSHTCHVCILPSATHFRSNEIAPLRLKSFQVGPTTHVLEQSPIVNALWHPLAAGDCLVTLTHDACVRLWEVDSENRSTFDEPALAVDLKKLANATSSHADFSTSRYGTNKGYSPDDVEMQVASACFGGSGMQDEHGWASMTLWVAMTEGDVYALCPLLPSKWRAPPSLLASLSTSVTEKFRATARDKDAPEAERRLVDQQTKWLADVDAQDPLLLPGEGEFDTVEVYSRPERLNAIPKLQGPFVISPEPDFGEITDIHVIAPRIDDDALFDEDFDEESADEGLSVGIICLATSTNEVHVCLDTNGVEAEWLPNKRSRAIKLDEENWRDLLLFETIDLARKEDEDDGWPTFTASPTDRYELFVTHPTGVDGLSFRPWIRQLENELSTPSDSGAEFRLQVLLDSARTLIDQPIDTSSASIEETSTAIAILDPILGYIVLTSAAHGLFATILDIPSHTHAYAPETSSQQLALPEPRAPYHPSAAFEQASSLPQLVAAANTDQNLVGRDLKAHIRFNPTTLQVLTEAHRIMASETHRLALAAADLFRRCERMRSELAEQVRRVAKIAQRVDSVTGQENDGTDGGAESEKDKIERRVDDASRKTVELSDRADALRRKMSRLGGPKLNQKEEAFAEEVLKLERSVLGQHDAGEEEADSAALVARFEAVQQLKEQLIKQAGEATERTNVTGDGDTAVGMKASVGGVGGDYRKQKLAQVMQLLERETVMIEAVMGRLGRLQGQGQVQK